jgi:hypothetical protein
MGKKVVLWQHAISWLCWGVGLDPALHHNSSQKNTILKKFGAPSGANSPFLRLETFESVVLY